MAAIVPINHHGRRAGKTCDYPTCNREETFLADNGDDWCCAVHLPLQNTINRLADSDSIRKRLDGIVLNARERNAGNDYNLLSTAVARYRNEARAVVEGCILGQTALHKHIKSTQKFCDVEDRCPTAYATMLNIAHRPISNLPGVTDSAPAVPEIEVHAHAGGAGRAPSSRCYHCGDGAGIATYQYAERAFRDFCCGCAPFFVVISDLEELHATTALVEKIDALQDLYEMCDEFCSTVSELMC